MPERLADAFTTDTQRGEPRDGYDACGFSTVEYLNWFVGGDHGTYHRPRRSPLSSTLAPNIVPRQHHSGIPTSCKDLD